MDNQDDLKLQPSVGATVPVEPQDLGRISPILWPLVGYLGAGTLLLFLVSQVERLAAAVAPWEASGTRWHEASTGWIANGLH